MLPALVLASLLSVTGAMGAGLEGEASAILLENGSLSVSVDLPGETGTFALRPGSGGQLRNIQVERRAGESVPFSVRKDGPKSVVSWDASVAGDVHLSYSIDGAIRETGGPDTVVWNILAGGGDGAIAQIRACLSLPGGVDSLEGVPIVHTGATQTRILPDPSGVCVEFSQIPPRSYARLEVHLDDSMFVGDASRGGLLAGYRIPWPDPRMLAAPLLSLLALSGIFFLRGRDPRLRWISAPPSIPTDMTPEVAGTVIDEYTDTRDLVAGVVDMARQGLVRIVYHASHDMEPSRVVVSMIADPGTLSPVRRKLAELVCQPFDKSVDPSLSLERRPSRSRVEAVRNAVQEQAVAEGYFRGSPQGERRIYQGLGVVVLGVGVTVILAGLWVPFDTTHGWGVLFASLPFFGFAPLMPQRTLKGSNAKVRIAAAQDWLREPVPSHLPREDVQKRFEEGLPTAISSRFREDWVARFVGLGVSRPTGWAVEGADEGSLSAYRTSFLDTLVILSAALGDEPGDEGGG